MTTSGRAVYGPVAQHYARSLAAGEPVVIFDQFGAGEALRDCASRRLRNETFFVRAVLQRENAARADAVTSIIVSSFKTMDERRAALAQAYAGSLQVNGQVLHSVAAYNPAIIRIMQAAVRLSDGLLVSSEAERRRIQEILRVDPPIRTIRGHDTAVPTPDDGYTAVERDRVLIWAPHLDGAVASSFVIALSDFHAQLLVLSTTPPDPSLRCEWAGPAAAATALARAKLVVDTSHIGADSAIPLAAWGVPMVADSESGAQELLDNIRTFDRRRMDSVFDAVINAIGYAPPRPRIHATAGEEDLAPHAAFLTEGPLVTIVIPTLDRPVLLRYALRSCRAQTYKNVETLVVVDGGPRRDDLAREFPEVRFVHMAENNPVVSTNTAFAAARGEYVTLLSDDDVFFPDHVAALVTALERSGAVAAHGDVLTAFLRGDDRDWQIYGFESNMSEVADLSSFLVTNKIGATSVMIRRSVLGDAPFDASIPLYRDYELWLRLLVKHDFVHVERITSCYTTRNQGLGQQSTMWVEQAAAAYRKIYDRYPISDRPLLEQRRAHMVRVAEQGGAGPGMTPAVEIQPAPWPLG